MNDKKKQHMAMSWFDLTHKHSHKDQQHTGRPIYVYKIQTIVTYPIHGPASIAFHCSHLIRVYHFPWAY